MANKTNTTPATEEVSEAVPQTMRRCPSHHVYFPDENEMRPLEEFRRGKDGKTIHPTYCKRCTSKKQTEYRKGKGSTTPELPFMKRIQTKLQESVVSLAAQIDSGDEAELRKLAKAFGATATEAVMPILQHYAEQREQLPEVVHDQRNTTVE